MCSGDVFSRAALESMGVSASCRRASRLWKTPKILAASATPRKPWRPSATVLKRFWNSGICFRFSTGGETKPKKRGRTQKNTTTEIKTCLCWSNLSNDSLPLSLSLSLSLSPFCFNFILTTLCPWNVICVPFAAVVLSWSVCEHVKVALVIHWHHFYGTFCHHCASVKSWSSWLLFLFLPCTKWMGGDSTSVLPGAICWMCRVKGESWKSCCESVARRAADVFCDVAEMDCWCETWNVQVELNMWDWFGSLQDVTNTSWGEHKRWWPDQNGAICVAIGKWWKMERWTRWTFMDFALHWLYRFYTNSAVIAVRRSPNITKVEMARHFSRSDRARVVNVWGKASYGPWPQVCSGSDSTY